MEDVVKADGIYCLLSGEEPIEYKEGVIKKSVNLFDNFENAYLVGANLKYANLEDANLEDASSINGISLARAKPLGKFYQVSGIGSRGDLTTYLVNSDLIQAGCFRSSLEEFEERVREVYGEDSQHGKEYLNAIEFFKTLKN